MQSLEGQSFGDYEIQAKLGQGGMGAVYKAQQTLLKRTVALKVMAPQLAEDPAYAARFVREAAAAANLNHPNMVLVYTAGKIEGTHYIAMEFVDGESLRKRLDREGRLDPREAVAITVYITQALQYAWNKARLIHRDIKPDNIFLSKAGEVKVGDLGLAKSVGSASTDLTASGMAMGSPHYISPEQARGLKDIDFRADIYSLGCTLYHMLTGRTPYDGDDSMSIMMKHVNEPPPAIFRVWPQCPMPLGMLVGRMLAKDRNTRHRSYEDLLGDLLAVHDKLKHVEVPAPVAAAPAPAQTPTPAPAATSKPKTRGAKPVTRDSRLVIGGAAAAVVLLVAAGLFLWSPWKERGASSASPQYSTTPPLQDSTSPAPSPQPSVSAADSALRTPHSAFLGKVFTNSVGAEMVYIPPGEFMMGSTPEEQAWVLADGYPKPSNEGDQPRKTKIKQGFWLGRTDVTVGQWKRFVAATGYQTDAEKKGEATVYDKALVPKAGASWKNPGRPPYAVAEDNYPVCCISWNDAVAFCEWLTEQERQAGRLPKGQVIRLPTEAEWEYACRAGTQTKFWWGESPEDGEGRLNWYVGRGAKMTPVDSFGDRGRNGFGLADMLGNVRQWCLDDYDSAQAHEECYQGKSGKRVLRSGAGGNKPILNRSACRNSRDPSYAESGNGFRVCCGPDVLGAAAFVREVTALPAEEQVRRVVAKLKELNSGFDGQATHKIENGVVTELEFSTLAVSDISPVRALGGLQILTCQGELRAKGILEDLSPLKGMGLKELRCASNPIRDLSPVRGMQLTVVACGNTEVDDLSPLKGMPLKTLHIWLTRVTDLSPLKETPLKILKCDFKPERDAGILRSIRTLGIINDMPAAEFWRRVDAGQMAPAAPEEGAILAPPETRVAALTANPKVGEVGTLDIGGGVTMELMGVPPGEFMLGSTKEEREWALCPEGRLDPKYLFESGEPKRTTIKNGFWLARTEITVGQWQKFVDATGYVTDAEKSGVITGPHPETRWGAVKGGSWRDPHFGFPLQKNHVVSCISWNDAVAFCEWLTKTEAKAGRLPAGCVCRLPTEAEWEYACRAGTQTKFWWGDTMEGGKGRLNVEGGPWGDEYQYVSPADAFGPLGRNGFGLADMLGNVYEWCLDGFDPEFAHPDLYTTKAWERALRGGSFHTSIGLGPGSLRCAARFRHHRLRVDANIGFRVCLGPAVGSTATISASPASPKETGILAPAETRVAALTANPKVGEVCTLDLGGSVTMELMGIPPGEFQMGSTKEDREWAMGSEGKLVQLFESGEPKRARIKNGFWMGRTEVTVGQWRRFVEATGYVSEAEKKGYVDYAPNPKGGSWTKVEGRSWRDPGFDFPMKEDYPVCCITWNDAAAFCKWLTESEHRAGRLPTGLVYRLPTEAAWEYACRAGTLGKFWWGDEVKEGSGRFNGPNIDGVWRDNYKYASPVDVFSERGRNGFGLSDMLGNVCEWCLDGFDPKEAHEGPYLEKTTEQVVRGGSFPNRPGIFRCAARERSYPSSMNAITGFRVCAGVPVDRMSASLGSTPAASKEDGILAPAETRATTLTANPKVGEVFALNIGSNVTMDLMGIPPGEFMMGSTAQEREWTIGPEGKLKSQAVFESGDPRRTKITNGFWLGRTEVTVGQWRKFVDATGYASEAEKRGKASVKDMKTGRWGFVEGASWRNPNFDFPQKDNHPVCCVNWSDAVAFCRWLTETGKRAGTLSEGLAYRLPSEAEWEYACRAGTQTKFWWGDTAAEGRGRANGDGSSWDDEYSAVSPVDAFGQRGRNGFGLADMLGNVYEWCLDDFDLTQAHAEPYSNNNGEKVLRGGSFSHSLGYFRCASRFRYAQSYSLSHSGFRVCCGVDLSASTTTAASPSPSIGSRGVDDAFIKEVAPLSAEQQVQRVVAKLKELNPGFDGKETHQVEHGVVTRLDLNAEAIADISPVQALRGLRHFPCPGTATHRSRLADISPLRGLKLVTLDVAFTSVEDIGVLEGMPLEFLRLTATKVGSVTALKGMPLRLLFIAGTSVRDLSPLRGLPLEELQCDVKVEDLSPLKGLPLKRLSCGFVPARDTDILRSIKTLETINTLPVAEFWRKVDANKALRAK